MLITNNKEIRQQHYDSRHQFDIKYIKFSVKLYYRKTNESNKYITVLFNVIDSNIN